MSEVSDGPEQQPPSASPEPRLEVEVLAAGAAQAEAVRDLEAAHAAAEDPEQRRAVSDLTLDKLILSETVKGNF